MKSQRQCGSFHRDWQIVAFERAAAHGFVTRSIPLVTVGSWVTASGEERPVLGGRLQLHHNKGRLQGFVLHRGHRPRKCHGYKDVSTDSEQALMSAVAKQAVPIALETDIVQRVDGCMRRAVTIMRKHVVGLKRTSDQKLSSGLFLTFMTTHLFQFRFADTVVPAKRCLPLREQLKALSSVNTNVTGL